MAIPKEIRFDGSRVYLTWSDGHQSVYANKRLREGCPCAVCKGERGLMGELYMPPSGAGIPPDIRVVKHALVGRYAVTFAWSDGHSTGIYTYEYLLELCECERCAGKVPGEERREK